MNRGTYTPYLNRKRSVVCDFHNFAAEIYLFSCESNSRTSRPRSVSESLSLSVIQFNNIIITSFQPSLDTSVYVNPLWISIKTLKNQYFAIIGHSGLVDFWLVDSRIVRHRAGEETLEESLTANTGPANKRWLSDSPLHPRGNTRRVWWPSLSWLGGTPPGLRTPSWCSRWSRPESSFKFGIGCSDLTHQTE